MIHILHLEPRMLFSTAVTLASFSGAVQPMAITVDSQGNLFGTCGKGGPADAGSIWELPAGSHSIKTLYYFTGNSDGDSPDSIAVDAAGNLYGTALNTADGQAIWELPKGSTSVIGIGDFNGVGNKPTGISIDPDGNLFGTTWGGGQVDPYSGTVWELTPQAISDGSGADSLYSFGYSGVTYALGIAVGTGDNLYVTTSGTGGSDDGDFVELSGASGSPATLYSFAGDGTTQALNGGIAVDSTGNVFVSNLDAVAELPNASGTLKTLYSFPAGVGPQGLTLDQHGNLYGVTFSVSGSSGVIFKIANAGHSGSATTASGTLAAQFDKTNLPPQVVAGAHLGVSVPLFLSTTGGTFKGTAQITYFADTSATLDGNQVSLGSMTRRVVLGSNGRMSVNFMVKSLPASLPDGTYYILADVEDSSGGSNVIATTQSITVAAPNDSLTPESAKVQAGGAGTANGWVKITNTGNSAPANGKSMVQVFSSPDGSTEDSLLTTVSLALALRANQSRVVNFHLNANEQAQAASDGYIVFDVFDPSRNDQTYGIADTAAVSGTGGGGGSGVEKLVLVSTDLPRTAPIQQDITIDDTFVNQGADTDDAVVDYYISTSRGLGGAAELGSADLGPLAHGQRGYGDADLSTGNVSVIGGDVSYYILWVDDSNNQVFAARLISFRGS